MEGYMPAITMTDPTPENIRAVFAKHNLRCTRQREDVYRTLLQARTHPTADELFDLVQSVSPGISLATIYNTLETFTEKGLCRRFASANQGASAPCRYDADLSPHLHVVDPDGTLHDIPDDLSRDILDRLPPDLIEQIERRMGVRIGRVNLDFIAQPADDSA